ncbi:MAG TPA: hypothetical protein VJA19_09140, partial [Pseudomonas sp.]|nr:hypothetical protein [Pseudomonas sp.]
LVGGLPAAAEAALGQASVGFRDDQGQALPAQALWLQGELDTYLGEAFPSGRAWLIANPPATLNLLLQDHAGEQSLELNLPAASPLAAQLSLDPGAVLSAGARLPLAAAFAAGSTAEGAQLDLAGSARVGIDSLHQRFHWIELPESGEVRYQWQDGAGARELTLNSKPNQPTASLTLSGAGNNQLFPEGSALSLGYQVDEAPAWVEIELRNFNGKTLTRLFSAGQQGQFSLRLPQVGVQESLVLRARAFFPGDFHYSEQQLNLRVVPVQQLPQPVLSGLPSQLYADSLVELRLSGVDASRYRLTLEALDQQDRLLASGTDRLDLRLPAGISELRVRALLSDELGNQQSLNWSAQVLDAWRLQSLAERLPFDHMLPRVGGHWLARGAELHDPQGLRQRLPGNIAALDYLQQYLLLSVKGFGLTLLDPQDNLRVAGQVNLAAPLNHLAVQGERILGASGRELYWFDATGAQLKASGSQSLTSDIRQLQAHGDGFLVLSGNQLLRLSASGQTLATFNQEGLSALATVGEQIYLADSNARLWRLGNNLQGDSRALGGTAQRLIPLPGQLLALSDSRAQLVDLATRQRIGAWPISASGVGKAQWAAGKLWLGGSEGRILQPLRGGLGAQALYDSRTATAPTLGALKDLALFDGQLFLAADNFGAQLLRQDATGGWSSSLYPSLAFTEAASQVAVGGEYWFVLQPQQQRIIALARTNLAAQSVFGQLAASDMTVSGGQLIATAGGSLHLAALNNLGTKRSLVVTQENLEQLSAYGSQAAVLSESGRVFLVDLRVDAPRPVQELSGQLGGEVQRLAFNGEQLFYLSGERAWRYDLRSQTRSELLGGAPVSQLYWAGNLLWLEQPQAQGFSLAALEPSTDQVIEASVLQLSQRSSALAVERNRLAVGLGSQGVRLFELPYGVGAAASALLQPVPGTRLQPAQALSLGLADDGVRGLAFTVNGQPAGELKQGLNQARLRLPAGLPLGQTFSLGLRVEDAYGVIRESVARDLFLEPGDGVANPFSVTLSADEHSWLPLPLSVSALVNGSQQPMAQVEFLVAASAEGPWQRLALRRAEPFQASLALDNSFSGQYLKVRAVDVFGNSAVSPAKRFYRHQDTKVPTVSLSYAGSAVFTEQNKAVRGYPFTVKAQMADSEGALDKATLLRNGQVVAVAFGQNLLSYQDAATTLGEQVFSIEVRDRAGNIASSELRVTVIDDNFPGIEPLVAPAQLIEQSSFSVQLTVEDDVAVKAVDILWNGFTDHYDFNQKRLSAHSFTVKDRRSERVVGSLSQPLLVKVTDSRGQVSESQPKSLTVVRDQQPNLQALQVTLPTRGVYGGLVSLQLNNLNALDDTGGLALRVFNLVGDERRELFNCLRASNDHFYCGGSAYWNVVTRELRLPDGALPNDQYRLQVELTDRIGQQVLSGEHRVALTQSPNQLRFNNLQAGDNPDQARVQERPIYRVQVLDAAARPVPDQPVQWRVRRLSDGAVLGLSPSTSLSDANGYASLSFDTDRVVGEYQLWADLPQFSQIARAEKNLSIVAGPTRKVLLSHLPAMAAGDSVNLTLQAQDAVLNAVGNDQSSVLELTLPAADFHVQPAPGIVIASTTLNGQTVERVRVTLKDGRGQLVLQAGQKVGQYSLPVSSSGNSIRYTSNSQGYIQELSALPLTLLPAAASQLRLLNDLGRAQADGEVLARGVKQEVRLQVMLQDRFGNPISQLAGQPANLAVQTRVTGAASVNGQAGGARIDLVQGQAWLAVSDESFEEVTLSLSGPVEALPQLDLSSQFRINFTLQPPEIVRAVIEAREGTQLRAYFEFDEPVRLASGEALKFFEGNSVRAGTASLSSDGRTLSFVPQQALVLGRCYRYDSSDSGLRGIARDDEVREQGAAVCAPHALFNIAGPVKLLAGQVYGVPALLASTSDVYWPNVGNRLAELGGQSQGFNWYYDHRITVPAFFSLPNNTIADGALLPLTLGGTIAGTPTKPVVMGNGLTLQVFDPLGDFDGDGLSNKIELETVGLDPTTRHSDGNGIEDGADDLDGDGLSNLEEATLGTKLRVIDTDGDGLSDGSEVRTHKT